MPTEKEKPREALEQQDQSIKARKHQLFEAPVSDASAATVKPFVVYLRGTPATPMPQGTRIALWGLAVVVVLLFLAALLAPHRPRPRRRADAALPSAARWLAASASASASASVYPATRKVSAACSAPPRA